MAQLGALLKTIPGRDLTCEQNQNMLSENGGVFFKREAKMVSRTKPKTLSENDVNRFLKDAQAMMKTINSMSIRVDSDQYRAMRDLNSLIWETAKVVAGNDRPWPVYCSVGPC